MRLLHAFNRVYCRVFHKIDVTGATRFPRRGPGIVVANHLSSMDPLLIQSAVGRPIVWMMASEYYDIGAMRWIFKTMRVIPVDRNGKDSVALRHALRTLSEGHLLGIFPEGHISTRAQVEPFQTGIGLIARRSRAPIFPVYHTGTHARRGMVEIFLRPQHVQMRFGRPLLLTYNNSHEKDLESITRHIRGSVLDLAQIEP